MRSMVKSHNSMPFKSSTNWSHDLPVISWFTNHYNPFFLGFVIVTCWFSRSARAVFSVLPFSFMLLFWLFPSVLFLMQLRPHWALGPHGCPTFHTARSGRKWPTTPSTTLHSSRAKISQAPCFESSAHLTCFFALGVARPDVLGQEKLCLTFDSSWTKWAVICPVSCIWSRYIYHKP